MHELSLCEGLMRLIDDTARQEGFTRVLAVRLEVGALAGVEAEAMRFGFAATSRNTLADGASLELLPVPGQGVCPHCAHTVTISQRFDACPQCGGYGVRITGGDALRLVDLEVE